MNPLKIALLCFLCVIFEDLVFAAKDKFESCMSDLLTIGHETFKFPTNLNQMNNRCK